MNSVSGIVCRCLDKTDKDKLGDFFENNNCKEVTSFFHPFSLTRETAVKLLEEKQNDLFFAIEKDEKFIGFSMLRGYDEGFEVPNLGIFIDKGYYGKGLGKYLCEWTLRWGDQTGVKKIRLSVYDYNYKAFELYKSLGFVVSESQKSNGTVEKIIMHRKSKRESTPIYVSTSCLDFKEKFEDRLDKWLNYGIHRVECSKYPGIKPENAISKVKNSSQDIMFHNYFPPEGDERILNLASDNKEILGYTRGFYEKAIDNTAEIKGRWYSFHAGFVNDPIGRDKYGFVFDDVTKERKSAAKKRIKNELKKIGEYAHLKGVKLLVENNVCTRENMEKLLLVTPLDFTEMEDVFETDVSILLDLGHMKVSANTCGFDLDGFRNLKNKIYGVHLHDNDGISDQHLPLKKGSELLEIAKSYSPDFASIEAMYDGINDLQRGLLALEKEFNG